MKELFTSMLQALSDGQSVVLCSILASSGSTPRGAGAKMAVFADGHTVGTIGGGAVEKCSGEKALEVLQSKQSLVQGYCLAPNQVADIGMICGGNVTVYFQYFDPADENGRALLQGILELLRGDDDSWLVYRMDGGCVSAMGTFDEAHGLRFTDCITPEALRPMLLSNAFTKKGDPGYYIEPLTQAGHAYIFGGGHVGTALAPVLASVGFRVVIYDNRPDFAKPDHYPSAEQVILGDYLDIGAHLTLTENDYVCIMTPGHQADREVLLQAMRSPATYIGWQPPQDRRDQRLSHGQRHPGGGSFPRPRADRTGDLRPDPGGDRRLRRRGDDPPPRAARRDRQKAVEGVRTCTYF